MKYLTLLLIAVAAPVQAQITRLNSPIQFDGSPNEAAWQSIPTLALTATTKTIIKLAYDDAYFYAAGWFYDVDPRNDAFAVYLDDDRDARWFRITPSGMRFETLLSEDGDKPSSTWDTLWDAATTVTREGWFVEIRIPLSSLGGSGRVAMSVAHYNSNTHQLVLRKALTSGS